MPAVLLRDMSKMRTMNDGAVTRPVRCSIGSARTAWRIGCSERSSSSIVSSEKRQGGLRGTAAKSCSAATRHRVALPYAPSSTRLTFAASSAKVKGLGRSCTPAPRRPWWTMALRL